MSSVLHALMPNTYVMLMAQASRDPEGLVAGSGLSLSDILHKDEPITVRQQLICARNAVAMMARPDWHLAWAETVGEHFHGPLTTAWLSAPTLGDGLDAFVRYMPARLPYHVWRGRSAGGRFRVELKPLIDLGDLAPVLIELPMLALLGYLRTVRGGHIAGAVLQFAHAASVAQDRYEKRFHCEFRFDQRMHALVIPDEWRTVANAGHEPMLWRAAMNRCELDLKRSFDSSLVGSLRHFLMSSFDAARGMRIPPTVREAAGELHLSVRTLHRRLQAAGLSYQSLVDDARRERAGELLLDRRIKLGDVAAALGYRDPANFSRAYKRWHGISPRSARRD